MPADIEARRTTMERGIERIGLKIRLKTSRIRRVKSTTTKKMNFLSYLDLTIRSFRRSLRSPKVIP